MVGELFQFHTICTMLHEEEEIDYPDYGSHMQYIASTEREQRSRPYFSNNFGHVGVYIEDLFNSGSQGIPQNNWQR